MNFKTRSKKMGKSVYSEKRGKFLNLNSNLIASFVPLLTYKPPETGFEYLKILR